MINKTTTGFTLLELMIVVAIVGILSAIVYPSYQNSIMKSRRADAKGTLQSFAGAMERRFTVASSYCDVGGANSTGATVTDCGGGTKDTGEPTIFSVISPVDANPNIASTYYYRLTIRAVTVTPAGFTLAATPVGTQASDQCGTLTLTNTGVRGLLASDGSAVSDAATIANCW